MRSPRASEDEAISDFYVGINHEWADVLADRLENTPLAASLYEAVKPLGRMNIDVKKLEEIVETKLREWDRGVLQKVDGEWAPLPDTYAIEKAVCIHIYTLKDPEVRATVNQALESLASRRSFTSIEQGSGGRLEDDLLDACLPFIKYLDASLDTLPNSYVFKGEVHRRVKWVYPSVEDHKPEAHFKRGALLMWHGFRSASSDRLSVARPPRAGPRTVFTIDAVKAYKIGRFSGGAPLPSSVLFRPLSVFKLADARKNILDSFEMKDLIPFEVKAPTWNWEEERKLPRRSLHPEVQTYRMTSEVGSVSGVGLTGVCLEDSRALGEDLTLHCPFSSSSSSSSEGGPFEGSFVEGREEGK
eukprot:Cvel_22588.t1-p1 / transcript=Cvel_22588.t1 / gene=Cvel_22588 / organism=Chromera_velia_CCMP2878 / gene_product=hypothetical protein / transcript_product=hypothetical protein / location=Cvel_scaffold2234:1-3655(-) / protein_length=357 / sequence_SO=supercontig / SO=protein_coding / is_pseudo=false